MNKLSFVDVAFAAGSTVLMVDTVDNAVLDVLPVGTSMPTSCPSPNRGLPICHVFVTRNHSTAMLVIVTSDSFVLEVDSCPLCYGSERASVVGEAGSIGDAFCAICAGLE